MRVGLAAGPCLLAFASLAFAKNILYQTYAGKGFRKVGYKSKELFYIPKGQCSGFLNLLDVCGFDKPLAVRIKVSDNQAYPKVELADDLANATIYRMGNKKGACKGPANVNLKLYCLGENTTSFKLREALPPVPVPSATNTENDTTVESVKETAPGEETKTDAIAVAVPIDIHSENLLDKMESESTGHSSHPEIDNYLEEDKQILQ